ncbi:MAG: hypothetical protein ABWX74_02815 [Aeromicrobium sp.]
MARRRLRVSVLWFARPSGLSIWTHDQRTGLESEGLPAAARDLSARLSGWSELLRDHYAWVDDVDVTRGWTDEDVRREFVHQADELQIELSTVLGTSWTVDVSPEPGLACVRLMGEYGAHWPLWVADGGTCPESWPMLSAAMVERLERWAELADPDHYPGPETSTTETLRRDLARELGDRFRVTA